MTVKEYSEKSYIVYGDTKQYKEELKSLGGKFNMYLKDPENGETIAGWILKKSENILEEIQRIQNGSFVMKQKESVEKKSDKKDSQSSTTVNMDYILLKNKINDNIKSYKELISKLDSISGAEEMVKEYNIRLNELEKLI